VRGYSAFSNNLDCNVLAVDYRGFGDSSGTPSEEGLINDSRAVWDYVVQHASEKNGEGQGQKGVKEKDLILVGQSLGTGVVAGLAGQLAGEGKCCLLEFHRWLDMARETLILRSLRDTSKGISTHSSVHFNN
jgi:abhydrolase domain-containing protein 12